MNIASPVNIQFDPSKEGEIRFTLQWNNNRSFIDRLFKRQEPLLALGCYYVTDFGGKSLIDRLQFAHNSGPRDSMTRQGSFNMVPYIWHEGVERADSGECIESIIVNNLKLPKLKRIAVYAFVMAGKPRWKRINPQLLVEIPGNEPLTFDFVASPKRRKKVYAIIDIQIRDNQLCITPLNTLHTGHGQCNETYQWGLNIVP